MTTEEILYLFWDFMSDDQTADRREYSEEEQRQLVDKFLNSLK